MPRKAQTESVADAAAAPGGAAAVDRAVSLLAAFRSGDVALSLTELAERTRLYKSTVLRLLASLEHARLVQKTGDGHYGLGSEIARLHGIYAAAFSLDQAVMPVLRALVAQTGESAAYHVRQGPAAGWQRLCQYRVDSPNILRDHVNVGDVLPNDRGAGARVLVAFSPDLASQNGQKDRKLLAAIRATGYCALVGDRSAELAGISAPVFQADGSLAAALTLTMPAHRYNERHVPPVLAAARELSRLVG
ncbi:MAG: hypothetical protein RLZZ401_1911 [Pseudomonadota bacterium]|jgi:DNA-binding IclR family transcriptional regulator